MTSSSLQANYSWEEFDRLPRTGHDFLLDTAVIQRRLDARKDNPYRIRTVVFRAPVDCSRRVFEELKRIAGEKFLAWESQDGWELASPLRLTGPFTYHDRTNGAVLLGDSEYRWQGIFRQTRSQKAVRLELDPATVKQDPEHRLTLKEAMRAWGIKAPQPALQRGL